jgi:hypothetical protein
MGDLDDDGDFPSLMHMLNNDSAFSHLTSFQREKLFVIHMLGHGYEAKQWEAELPKAIARLLIQIAAAIGKHPRGHALFLAMLAQLFDPEIRTDPFPAFPARRKVRFVMTTKGHPKDHDIDETWNAETIIKALGVSERQAYRLKAKKKRGQKRT